jgi:perosamine synthetase
MRALDPTYRFQPLIFCTNGQDESKMERSLQLEDPLKQTKFSIPQAKPVLLSDMEEAAIDALRNDRFVGGENVSKFEEEFAQLIGTRYALAISSGTAALDFIFMSLKIRGQKVVTSTWSFIASANSILHAGGEPVLVDILDTDYCLDLNQIRPQLEKGAKGILPVHIYGQPVEFDLLQELGDKYQVPIVEDACQAHGATYKGRKVGSLGIAAAFSFYPSKNMTVLGDGGMVTTNDESIAKQVSKIRDSGRISQYEHDILGYTARLNSVNAAIGRVQLRHLKEWNERRKSIANSYFEKLASLIPKIGLPLRPTKDIEPVFHQFVIRARNRDELKGYLHSKGIQCNVHYPIPIHLQPLYVNMFGFREGMLPRSELLAKECLSLPMHPFLTDDEVDYICEEIVSFFSRGSD